MKPCKTCTRKLLDKKSPENGRKAQKKLRRLPVGVFWIVSSRYLNRLCELYIDRVQAFFALLSLKGNWVTFAYFVNQTADVNENFFARVWIDYETETFGFVEELDSSRLHTKKIEKMKSNCSEERHKGKQIYWISMCLIKFLRKVLLISSLPTFHPFIRGAKPGITVHRLLSGSLLSQV